VAVVVALAVFVSSPNHLSDAAVMVMLAVFASSHSLNHGGLRISRILLKPDHS